MSDRNKTLSLKKCYFGDGYNSTLESLISDLAEKYPNHCDRAYKQDLFRESRIGSIEKIKSAGFILEIFSYEEKGKQGLINFEKSEQIADIEEIAPPQNGEFLGNHITLLIKDNHVIACGLGNKDNTIATMIFTMAVKAGLLDSKMPLSIQDVPNKTEIKRISEVGVKNIDLNLHNYLANLSDFSGRTVVAQTSKILNMIFGIPDTLDGIRKRANTRGRLILTRGKWESREAKKDDWLTNIGQAIVQSENDFEEYNITLEDGTKVSTSKLKVSKAVKLKKYATTVEKIETKSALLGYYNELKANGSLEW
jgi:hypothetical protein